MKKSRATGRLGKINDLQRRDAQACYFEGRASLSYEMLKVLPRRGWREMELKVIEMVVNKSAVAQKSLNGHQIHSGWWSKTGWRPQPRQLLKSRRVGIFARWRSEGVASGLSSCVKRKFMIRGGSKQKILCCVAYELIRSKRTPFILI